MRGSKLAGIIESDMIREQRRKENILRRKFRREKCDRCKNKTTDLCHITKDIDGKLKCVNYIVEQNT